MMQSLIMLSRTIFPKAIVSHWA